LIFIFSPLETERALVASVGVLVAGVEVCPRANGERASANPKASAIDRSILLIVINLDSLSLRWQTRSLTASNKLLSSDDELLNHVVCRIMQTVFKERRVDELQRLVLHQLELTNSIEQYWPVKMINAETCVMAQLVAIHYFFARGLQEKGIGNISHWSL
jgi:hypothetical protein